jgi:hypothetical protein
MSDVYSGQPIGTRAPRYRRRERVNPQTGQREVQVWSMDLGRYVPAGSMGALAQEDQAALERSRALLGSARGNARLASQFLDENFRTSTGGIDGVPVPDFMQSRGRQRLEGITNQMVRTNIQPGQAGTMNSIIEQMLARQQYPTTGTVGSVNAERGIGMMVDEAEAQAYVQAAEQWAADRDGLQGFEADWTANRSAEIRREAEARIRREMAARYPRGEGGPGRRPVEPRAPAATPNGPPVESWERGPDGRMRRAGQ